MKKRTLRLTALLLLLVLTLSAVSCQTGKTPSETEPETVPATEPVTDPPVPPLEAGQNGCDFILDIPAGRDIKILQFTDTQTVDLKQARNSTRLNDLTAVYYGTRKCDSEVLCYRYMDEAVEKSQPDLIVLTGDIVYGEADDEGTLWMEICDRLDSYGIPWAPVFGNHDNESAMGVSWQIEYLLACKYCLFRQGDVTGNCNYNIVVRQGGEAKYLLYLLDSNGCREIDHPGEGIQPDNPDIDLIQQKQGIYPDQIKWMEDSAEKIFASAGKRLPILTFFHIPPTALERLMTEDYGLDLNKISHAKFGSDGDFGDIYEFAAKIDRDMSFFNAAKALGTVGMFFGHEHTNDASVVYEGVRLTFGLKTGTHTYWRNGHIGGTQIVIYENDNTFEVEHLYSEIKK